MCCRVYNQPNLCVYAADWQEASGQNVMSDNQSSSASISSGELQPKQDRSEYSEALQQEQSSKANSYLHIYQISI